MGARSGIALKSLQWFNRTIQFLCAALILGIYSYFLAALHNHDLHITRDVRAVEGISGAAVIYTLIGLLLLCCLAGVAVASFVAMVLDVAFIGAFIYVAVANKHGASSCKGYLDTPFGRGKQNQKADGSGGFTALPSFHTACRLQSASLAVSIIIILFFIFSILTELALARHHRKAKRFGPSPDNDYTSGYGKKSGGGFMGRIFKKRDAHQEPDDNALPEHTLPSQVEPMRQSYGTETTAVNYDNPYHQRDSLHAPDHAKQEAGFTHLPAGHPATQYNQYNEMPAQTNHHRYGDGVYDRV